jgi:hypothetical protein
MGFKNSESGNSLKEDNFKKLDPSDSLNLRKKNPWNPTSISKIKYPPHIGQYPIVSEKLHPHPLFGEIHSNKVDWHSVINLTKF